MSPIVELLPILGIFEACMEGLSPNVILSELGLRTCIERIGPDDVAPRRDHKHSGHLTVRFSGRVIDGLTDLVLIRQTCISAVSPPGRLNTIPGLRSGYPTTRSQPPRRARGQ